MLVKRQYDVWMDGLVARFLQQKESAYVTTYRYEL
jgi:hypothetical protein